MASFAAGSCGFAAGLPQPRLVAILVVRGVVFRGLTIDQLLGELNHPRVCLDLGHVIENLLGIIDIPLPVQRVGNEATPLWTTGISRSTGGSVFNAD
jgi:hypothetical protein